MKLAVVILIMLGLFAAGATAVLVQAINARQTNEVPSIEAVVAVRDLPAGTFLRTKDCNVVTLPADELPAGYLNSTSLATGQLLAVPVTKDQILTQGSFVEKGSTEQLYGLLPQGMRAFTISLSSGSVTGGLLNPGSMVDVLATFSLRGSTKGEAVSITLLQNVRVLAVEQESVITREAQHDTMVEGNQQRVNQRADRLRIMLMVNNKAAEALHLALSRGNVALAIRNPADDAAVSQTATVLDQGQIIAASDSLDPQKLLRETLESLNKKQDTDANSPPVVQAETTESGSSSSPPPATAPGKNAWGVQVIRGTSVSEEKLDPALK